MEDSETLGIGKGAEHIFPSFSYREKISIKLKPSPLRELFIGMQFTHFLMVVRYYS